MRETRPDTNAAPRFGLKTLLGDKQLKQHTHLTTCDWPHGVCIRTVGTKNLGTVRSSMWERNKVRSGKGNG